MPEKLKSVSRIYVSKAVGAIGITQSGSENVLASVTKILNGAKALGADVDESKLSSLHPALHWWSGCENLIHISGDQAVSMNLRDVIANHSDGCAFNDRSFSRAGQNIWQSLSDRYKQYSAEIPNVLSEPLASKLAMETVEA